MRNFRHRVAMGGVIALLALTPIGLRAQDAKVRSIFDHMQKLKPLIGHWTAAIDFHNRDGSVTQEAADYAVKPVLDGTYLQWDVTVSHKDDPTKRRSFMIMTTFNPDTAQYEETYFYSRWAIRVTETGDFDEAAHEFRTVAFIPREDGVHDESVHTTTRIESDGSIDYWHWSRYDNEKNELMNFHAKLTPAK